MRLQESVVDVRAVVDEHRFSPYQWWILILGIMVLMLDGYDVAAIGFIAPALVTEWGIARPDLAPVLSAAIAGLAMGAVVSGPVADRIGRKKIIVLAVLLFGVFAIASAFARTIETLTWLRFITGLGLGAAFPNTVTLVAEYCPQRNRSLLVSILLTGFVLGTALGGLVAAQVVASHGWPSVLMIGGILPLLLVVALMTTLPESLRFMVLRGDSTTAIHRIIHRIAPQAAIDGARYISSELQKVVAGSPLRMVLTPPYALGSCLLWLTYFAGLVVVYFILSWMPTLITQQGFDLATAARLVAFFTLAGPVGAWLAGWVMDHWSPHWVIGICYLLGGVFLWGIGANAGSLSGLYWTVGGAGFFINAAQSTLSPLAANFYPTQSRATGISWMMGVGRLGGIFGSMLGGTLLTMQMLFSNIFLILAAATVVASVAVISKGVYYGAPARGDSPAARR